MDISSITVNMAGGDNYVIPMQDSSQYQQSIKDMLLAHLLKKTHSKGLQENILKVFKVSDESDFEHPLISKCTYTNSVVKKDSKQMKIRNTVVDYFESIGNAFESRLVILEMLADTIHGLKSASISNYVNSMIAAEILEKHERDSSMIRLTNKFLEQQSN